MTLRAALGNFVERRPFSIIIFNRRTRVTDGQSCKPRAIEIPNIHLSFAGITIEWVIVWKFGLRI